MMNRKDIICHPGHIGVISPDQPSEFIGYRCRRPAAVGFTKHLMTAPLAVIGGTAGPDQRHRPRAIMFAPDRNVTGYVDGLARRPRLCIDVANLIPWPGLDNVAARGAEGDSRDLFGKLLRVSMQHRE